MPNRLIRGQAQSLPESKVVEGTIEESAGRRPGGYSGELKNPHAVALGRLGGKKGGRARAKKLSAERRKQIAQLAAKIRWGKD